MSNEHPSRGGRIKVAYLHVKLRLCSAFSVKVFTHDFLWSTERATGKPSWKSRNQKQVAHLMFQVQSEVNPTQNPIKSRLHIIPSVCLSGRCVIDPQFPEISRQAESSAHEVASVKKRISVWTDLRAAQSRWFRCSASSTNTIWLRPLENAVCLTEKSRKSAEQSALCYVILFRLCNAGWTGFSPCSYDYIVSCVDKMCVLILF